MIIVYCKISASLDIVSYGSGWPLTCYIAEDDHELLSACPSQVFGIQQCTTIRNKFLILCSQMPQPWLMQLSSLRFLIYVATVGRNRGWNRKQHIHTFSGIPLVSIMYAIKQWKDYYTSLWLAFKLQIVAQPQSNLFFKISVCLSFISSYPVDDINIPTKAVQGRVNLAPNRRLQSIVTGKSRQQELEAAVSIVKRREQ